MQQQMQLQYFNFYWMKMIIYIPFIVRLFIYLTYFYFVTNFNFQCKPIFMIFLLFLIKLFYRFYLITGKFNLFNLLICGNSIKSIISYHFILRFQMIGCPDWCRQNSLRKKGSYSMLFFFEIFPYSPVIGLSMYICLSYFKW